MGPDPVEWTMQGLLVGGVFSSAFWCGFTAGELSPASFWLEWPDGSRDGADLGPQSTPSATSSFNHRR